MSCLRCNGLGFLTSPAPVYRKGHQAPVHLAGRLLGHVHHGREARICEACDGSGEASN